MSTASPPHVHKKRIPPINFMSRGNPSVFTILVSSVLFYRPDYKPADSFLCQRDGAVLVEAVSVTVQLQELTRTVCSPLIQDFSDAALKTS